ncbi:hypothetical protein MC885_018280 [Smutsia gigantea]|nr:hypothetical protein MC885_018280 [Smutsia gigantea]
MKSQHWKPEKMFKEAEKFFTSLGLLSPPPEFWKKSMLERPTDGWEVECMPPPGTSMMAGTSGAHSVASTPLLHPPFLAPSSLHLSACLRRIKKCTKVTIEDQLSIFHQMGHTQYFLQYKNLSMTFCAGASPASEEAVGLVITLSASSPGLK